MTYGIVHLHSEHSLKDGAQSIHDMVARAKEMGAKAITLTDHGTCTGWVNFLKETEDAGIKGILGVEAYVRDDICDTRRHLILLAKNKQGYQELSHAVTESNKNIESTKVGNKEFNFPVMNFELLKKCFGNGNVIATSACVTGVLSSILLKDHYRQKNIEKLRKKQSKYESPDTDSEYHALLKAKESIEETVEELKTLKNEKTKLANKKYKRRRLNLKYIENEEEKEKELLQIEKEEEESLRAKEELPSIQTRIKNEKKQITALNKDIRKKENSFTRYSDFEEEIKTIEGTLQGEEALLKETEEELFRYLSLFGKNFYIEIQYHGMPEEEYVFTRLISLARKHRVPLVAANDAHITYPSQTDKREFMRSLQFIRWEPSSDYDKELYMKTDEELSAFLEKVYIKEAVEAAMRNIKKLCDSCEPIHILHEKHYPTYRENGEIIKNSKKLLLEKVRQGAKEKFPEGLPQEYKDRVNHEFKTICDMGFADYHLIVADYLNYGRMLGKTNTKEKCGYAIGPARGSAAGSLLCYLIGITSINPMPYDLLFERFLNPERVSMPDIDADFSDEVRDACIDYVTQKYGRESVACIRTTMTMAARSSVRNAGKIISSKHYGDKMALDKLTDSMAKSIPSKPKIKLSSPLDEGASLTVEENLCQEYNTPEAREIVELAKKAEGSIINLGIHAAGIIIGNEEPLDHFIPLLYSDKKGWATQCDMIEAEEIGLLKMDFLGLKNLDVLTDAIRMIKRNHGISIDLDNLPQEPEIYREIFAKGFTNSIFQFESSGMKDVLQRFQPDCFEDIILIVALYRPGPMQFIPDVIDVKHHRKAPSYGTPLLEPILGKTYGSIIYQEQVMLIFQNLAGYSLGFADLVRRAMSKKHFDEIERERNSFLYGDPDRNIKGCIANGIDKDTANTLFDQMTEFAKYAFNKSHAAAYSMISYQTAYLKYHYPVEYMASVMTHEKNEKMNALIYDCKQMGIQVLPIDVNRSYSSFVPENGNIRYGLSMMKNMGNNGDKIVEERLKNGPYQSVQDFIERTDVSKSVLESLALSGGFDSFIGNHRLAWASSMADLKQMIKDQKKKESQYAEKPNDLLKETITLSKNSIQYFGTSFPEDAELEALNREHEFLGAYVSKHPLESYRAVYQHTMTIDGFKEGYHQLAGLITNLRFVKKKADGASMAFFTLEDISGSIEVCVFPKVFHQLKPFLKEGNIVYVKGKCIIEREEREDDEPIENYKIFANEMSECVAFQENIVLSIDNRSVMKDNIDLQNYIKHFFHSDNGIPFIIFNKETGEAKRSPSLLSKDILKTPIPYKGITGVLQKINP